MLYSAAVRQGDLDWLQFVNTTFDVSMHGHLERDLRHCPPGLFRDSAAGSRAGPPDLLTRPSASAPGRHPREPHETLGRDELSPQLQSDLAPFRQAARGPSPQPRARGDLDHYRHGDRACARARSISTATASSAPPSQLMSSSSATFRFSCLSISSSTAFRRSSTSATTRLTSFVATLSIYARRLSRRGSAGGIAGGPAGADRGGQGDRTDAVATPRPCPPADRAAHQPAGAVQYLRVALQGHVDRVRHRRPRARLRRAVDQHSTPSGSSRSMPSRRRCISSPATGSSSSCASLERRYAIAR